MHENLITLSSELKKKTSTTNASIDQLEVLEKNQSNQQLL
jgi:hypothetical protein